MPRSTERPTFHSRFRCPFNAHFITKQRVNDSGCRVISYSRTKSVVSICLLPYCSVFQTNHCPAGQAVKGTIHTAHKKIELCALCARSSFLFGSLPITLQPGIELLQLSRRQLI